jgi:hypothetical protein
LHFEQSGSRKNFHVMLQKKPLDFSSGFGV